MDDTIMPPTFPFCDALQHLNAGQMVQHVTWDSRSFLILVPRSTDITPHLDTPYAKCAALTKLPTINIHSHIDFYDYRNNEMVCGWTPTSNDMLDDGWLLVNPKFYSLED